jgi:tetratricopeptide (TPR) repeat protein
LKLKLTRQEQERLATHYTEDTEAYQAYVKGRYFWNKRTHEGLTRGIAYFQQAIEQDFGYALAYAGLADCYNLLGFYGFLSPMETYPKAKAAAIKALKMDDALAEAHNSLAWAKLHFDFDWSGAEREFKQAHQLNPGYATAHHWYTAYLSAMGRLEEAIAEMKRAQMLDPLSLIINTALGQTFYFARQYDLAMEHLAKTLEMDPNFVHAHILLGKVYVQKATYENAIAEFQKAITLENRNSPYSRGLLGYAYAVMGNKEDAVKVLEELKALSKRKYVPSYNIAEINAGLGWNDQAFKWLEKAYEQRDGAMVWLKVEPALDSLRPDPRFHSLLRRMRLAP